MNSFDLPSYDSNSRNGKYPKAIVDVSEREANDLPWVCEGRFCLGDQW